MNSHSKAIVFDLDGVIRYWDPEIVARAEAVHGLPAGAIFVTAFEPDLLNSVITGGISDQVWRESVIARLAVAHSNADARAAVAAWSAPFGEVIATALAALTIARQHGSVCLLTNATDRLSADLQQLGIAGEFDHIFNSSEIGYAKPDARAFAHIEEHLGLAPAEMLFFDDSATNVQAAKERNWNAVLVQPGDNLERLLIENLGLL